MNGVWERYQDSFLFHVAIVAGVVLLLLAGVFVMGSAISTASSAWGDMAIGNPYEITNVVQDVSFVGAHDVEVHHAKTGYRTERIPDKWYINLCDVNSPTSCFYRTIRHAPWGWESVGRKVAVTWQKRNSGATVEKVIDELTQKEVNF